MLRELLSRDPNYVPVNDLVSYQEGLIDTGYLPPTYVPTGNWDDVSAAADRRASRDAFNTARSGGSYLAASTKTLFRYLGYTVPTSVFEGMYGIATGIVGDATRAITHPVEVFQEGGAVGGAAVGAGIGAGIGSIVPGAGTLLGGLVGAGIGGVAGFFGDLFDDDEDEDGTWQTILGALTPIDEIKSGDAKNLFAALSTIMTASAVLKAGQVAKAGVVAARAMPVATGGISAGGFSVPLLEQAGKAPLRFAFQRAAKGTVAPGLLNQFAQAGLKRHVLGSAVLGGTANALPEALQGDFTQAVRDFGTGAAIGAVAGPVLHKLGPTSRGLARIQAGLEAAPLARVAGSSAGKVAQALYTGAAAPTIVARGVSELSGDQTSIGERIEEAPDLGPVGTVVDWTLGSLIFPERLLPWRGADVSKAMRSMSTNHALLPFIRHQAAAENLSVNKAAERVKEILGHDPKTGGLDEELLQARVLDDYNQYAVEKIVEERIAERVAKLRGEDAYDRLGRDIEIERIAMEERSLVKQQMIEEAGEGSDDIVAHSPLANEAMEKAMSDPIGMQNFLSGRGFDLTQTADYHRAQEKLLPLTGEMDGKAVRFMPAVKGEYLTAQDFERFGGKKLKKGYSVGEYEDAANAYKQARDDFDNPAAGVAPEQLDRALIDAGKHLDEVLNEMLKRRIIDTDIYRSLRPGVGDAKVEQRLVNYLRGAAAKRPREIPELTDELADIAGGRYIAIATGENMLDYTNFLHHAKITGLSEYRRNFGDTLASLFTGVDRTDVGRIRYNSIVSHLDNVADDVLMLDGKGAADAIYDELKTRYDVEASLRRGDKLTVQLGTIIKRENEGLGQTTKELFKIDPRDLTTEDIVKGLDGFFKKGVDPYEAAAKIKKQIHIGAAFGADVSHPIATARALASSLRVVGLPGFNDFMRTTNFIPTKMMAKAPSARWNRRNYGYLPHKIRRAHMAVQFTLSPSFDISRYIEAMMFGKFRGQDIPLRLAFGPASFVSKYEDGWIDPQTGQLVKGPDAVKAMTAFGDRVLYGRAAHANFDELQLRLLNTGFFGFKPREVEYAQAWWLAQKKAKQGPLSKADLEEIRETVMQIGQYGTKVSPAAASAHFVFFPFLFSRKQLSAMVDYSLGAPTRNLLIHEGFRRWYSVTGEDGTTMSEDFARFMEKHVPVAAELGRLNNLAYGISPGRFFLDGIADKPSLGKATQALTGFFVPGGVHQPIADATGNLANLFTPVVLVDDPSSGQTGNKVLSLLERLIPAYRDLDKWFADSDRYGTDFGLAGAQASALSGRGTPIAQMGEYLDNKRMMGTALESIALANGFSSWESMRNASPEIAAAANDLDLTLGAQFPEGKRLAQQFTNKAEIKEQTLYDLAQKEDRTEAEEAIATIGLIEVQAKEMAAQTGQTQEQMLRSFAPLIRAYASRYFSDRQFNNLWDGLGFRSMYGPIREVKVA